MSPDITMCRGVGCPHRENCYRFTAKQSEYQSFFMESPIKDGKCNHYWGDNPEIVWNDDDNKDDAQ